MERALALAREGIGLTSPNPSVGCVIVQEDGAVVGEGATQPPGGPHAEVVALGAAGARARGATAYVTLEPCNHHGRTPPCTDALIEAGVGRVVFSIIDPDGRVAGTGRQRLEAAGIAVEIGDGAEATERLLEAYIKHRRTGLPFVSLKYAASLDGRIAAASGDSRWVSGPETLRWAHAMRPHLDAILVGSATVVVDNPQLTARPDGVLAAHQPLRVVLDSSGSIDAGAAVLGPGARTLVATTQHSTAAWRDAITSTGAEVLVLPEDAAGRVALAPLLADLGRRGVLWLLVEGGGVVNGAFFDAGLVDKLHAVIAPMVVGAATAATAVAGTGAERMADAVRLRDITVERLGEDVLVTGYPVWPEKPV